MTAGPAGNPRGMILMVVAMAAFALEDMFIKLASPRLPTGQILVILGASGVATFAVLAARRGLPLLGRDALHPAVLGRNLGEMAGTIGFVTALAAAPLTVVSAILQAAPLVVTMGAALFLGEQVGWRRWAAIAVGFGGMLLIIRPWGAEFAPASLLAVLGVLGLSCRDLLTRRVPPRVDSVQLSAWAMASVVLCGLALLAATGGARWPDRAEWTILGGAAVVGGGAYWLLTEAMRAGEVSAVMPFRYSRLVFALAVGVIVFDERVDAGTAVGSVLIVGSGLYAFARERRRAHPGLARTLPLTMHRPPAGGPP